MEQIKIMVLSKRKIKKVFLIFSTTTIGFYLLISLYFINHFPFHTELNGMDISLKSHDKLSNLLVQFIQDYKLQLFERNGVIEIITCQDIGMQYNKNITVSQIISKQNPFLWINSLFKRKKYSVNNLYNYNKTMLDKKINRLKCMSGSIIVPQNVSFQYSNESYEIIKEIYGNKINPENFMEAIHLHIVTGKTKLNLDSNDCYMNPTYKENSEKTVSTRNLLNKYLSAKITYQFGNATQEVDRTIIHQWLSVDENLDVIINRELIADYIAALSEQYNTVGILREFNTSNGKKVELKDGIYGWKIDNDAEIDALLNNIKNADIVEKEPVYLQRAFSREGNEIGNTYIEINITTQHLWFYKDGKLITQGAIVTGNPNRNNATVIGAYMVNYKQKEATLKGAGYEANVTYWIPFFGNMGLHDASWRYSFGGEIYKRNGTHGCVNLPFYLAKTIFEHIEEGTPVIIYE